MATLNVADKPTLDSVLSETATLITRGGIRHNGTNPQVYDTTNDTWVDLPSGGSLSPTIIIKNHFYQDGDMDNLDITVSDNDGLMTTQTVNMGTDNYIAVDVPHLGKYTLECTFDNEDLVWNIYVDKLGGVSGNFTPRLVSWATGTDAEIVELIKWADRGMVDLVVDAGWAVGDTREVNISAIATSGTFNNVSWSVGESHAAQTINLVLMDAGSTSETGSTYANTAATSYQLVNSVKNKDGSTRTNPSFIVGVRDLLSNGATTEYGYMNSSDTNSGSWNNSARRKWCNGGFMSALPSTLRPIFKQANVITAASYSGSTNQTTQDYCMLFAAKEIYGGTATSAGSATSYSNLTEFNALKQIEWYKTSANRIKKTNKGTGAAYNWWERSPYYSHSSSFCYVYSDGSASGSNASSTYGLAPACFI